MVGTNADKQRAIAGRGYERLEVYQRAMRAMKTAHQVAAKLPEHERYDLASQMRRASKSVVANIVEGYAKRAAPKEFARSLSMSLGSANEMEAHYKIARELEYLSAVECVELIDEYEVIGRQLKRLGQYWRKQPRESG